jgi:hypothetical protein
MAEFTFNLSQLATSAAATGSRINTAIFAKTPDSELIYNGDDYIVWDRTNQERLRRGLPGLAAIGLPRPPEDTSGTQALPATGTTSTPSTEQATVFAVKGPPGLTREQAFEIFKKQVNTGALVGFKSGDSLSAATQAADGLASAQSALLQAQSGLTGSIGAFTTSLSASGVDLATGRIASVDAAFARGGINGAAGSFVNVIGSLQPGLGAAGGADRGSLTQTAAGLTAAVGPAVSAVSGAVSLIPGAADAGKPLVNAVVTQSSTAIAAIQTINKTITEIPVTNPINTADFTKFASGVIGTGAVSGIGPMGVAEVNGVLAQAKNLVAQDAAAISNDKGLGTFGLDLAQLEAAGYVKPGTRALAEKGASLFSTVIKSPAAWTGKDGIKSATDLLSNPSKQSLIQQDLMTKGVADLAAVGVPVQNLSSQGIAGMALNAAKDLPSAEAFAKGLPIPGDATGQVQAAFSSAVRDGAFAVNLVNTKIPTAFKQQDIPVPQVDTVNRATVDAASTRVVGDEKVPVPSYTTPANTVDYTFYVDKAKAFINQHVLPFGAKLQALDSKFAALQNQQTITQAQYNALGAERDAIRNDYSVNGIPKGLELAQLFDSLPELDKAAVRALGLNIGEIAKTVQAAIIYSNLQKERLYVLSQKIEGRGEGE